jgi:hypothetical protein
MQRRETYATTGPRMTVRFFGGWEFKDEDVNRPNSSAIGYEKGVPMGGELAKAKKGRSPQFMITALKDPEGANLDRVQVVKGWVDATGNEQEKVYNVAASTGRKICDNKLTSVGSTVNVKDATYSNSIGSVSIGTVRTDPDFNANESVFYYVRVMEIQTPRWTAYDAKRFKSKLPAGEPLEIQARAYTSPIWYTPK